MKIVDFIITRLVPFLMLAFLNGQLFCQKPDPRNSEFILNLKLTTVTSSDSINQIKGQLDSINSLNKQTGGKKIPFNFSKKWSFVYCVAKGYREFFPNQFKDTSNVRLDSIGIGTESILQRKGKTTYLIAKGNVKPVSGHKLFAIFGVSKIKFPLNYFPNVYARDSRFNGEWTAISLNKEYLIIRYVSSYPNGNQTSWYDEAAYYFKNRLLFYQ
ncbi:MAG: hypothetical protein SFY56_08750 [Bacteroidota bacterium]|nr:hypothetical protein [Bacteroidota bacterium]